MTVVWIERGGEGRAATGTTVVTVTDEASAAAALRLALTGRPVTIHAVAPRAILDVLYDDLRRLTSVEVRSGPALADDLTADERAVLSLLAAGRSVAEAAEALHLSLRTAERRLAAARLKLGAATTLEAVTHLGRPSDRP